MIEHHLHRVTRPAHATGGHQHHRATLSDGSVKVSFWRCASGTAPLHACPSEPDPLARLIVKVAEPATAALAKRCEHQPGPKDPDGRCLECRRAQNRANARRYRDRHKVA